jgi:hypothetical protein
MHVHDFQAKWRKASVGLIEKAAAQSHFNDLCAVLGQPTPAQADPKALGHLSWLRPHEGTASG